MKHRSFSLEKGLFIGYNWNYIEEIPSLFRGMVMTVELSLMTGIGCEYSMQNNNENGVYCYGNEILSL